MTQTLIIRISHQNEEPCFECWLEEHEALVVRSSLEPSLAAYLSKCSKIIVLVPGEQVLLTKIVMPHLSPNRLVKALQFALEDQLTEDSARLHFAIGRRLTNGELCVAVVSKEKMKSWEKSLRSLLGADYAKVIAFIPDMLALPFEPQAISIAIDHELARLKQSEEIGYVFEKNELAVIFELIIAKQIGIKTSTIHLYQPDQHIYLEEQDQKRLGVTVEVHHYSAPLIKLLAPTTLETLPINLLQREYAPHHTVVNKEKTILLSALLLSGWLLLFTLINLFQNYQLYREERALNQNLTTIYQSVYPNKKLPDQPKIVLQNELTKLRTSTQDSAFIRLLNSVSIVVMPMTVHGLTPEKASYRNNQLSLELIAQDAVILNQLKQALEQVGLKVKMGSAERSTSGSIRTRFTIEEMG